MHALRVTSQANFEGQQSDGPGCSRVSLDGMPSPTVHSWVLLSSADVQDIVIVTSSQDAMISMITRAERGNQVRRAQAAAASGASQEGDDESEDGVAFSTKIATSARRSLLGKFPNI